jgi:hypothetical protein
MKKAVLFVLVFAFVGFAVFGQSVSDFEYTTENGRITITKYNGSVKDVRIPESINGLPVVAIGREAFFNNQLTNIVIPNSIVSIGSGAFHSNQLTSITLPNSITYIGYGAFRYNQLFCITLPDNINIQPDSFYPCLYDKYIKNNRKRITFYPSYSTTNDFSIMILDSLVEIIKYNGSVRDIIIPERINGLLVVAIGNWAFENNQLTSITLPNSIKYIGFGAFADNQLTSIVIPNSITYIGGGAFWYNQLTSITMPNSITYIGDSAFRGNQLNSITLSNSITSIGNNAFSENQLKSIVIPNSITSIGRGAFADNRLTSVIIPNSVRILADNAFDSSVVITRQ